MKKIASLLFSLFWIGLALNAQVKETEPWTPNQLMKPAVLAEKITNKQIENTVIYGIGFDDIIEGSTYVGAGKDQATLALLRAMLETQPKDREVVLYCGCCPFGNCPNIRPTFALLNEMGFKNAKLLDITQNIRTNWISKGYPAKD